MYVSNLFVVLCCVLFVFLIRLTVLLFFFGANLPISGSIKGHT